MHQYWCLVSIPLNKIKISPSSLVKQRIHENCISDGGTSPINTGFLDHRYLDTAYADFDVYWCNRPLSQMSTWDALVESSPVREIHPLKSKNNCRFHWKGNSLNQENRRLWEENISGGGAESCMGLINVLSSYEQILHCFLGRGYHVYWMVGWLGWLGWLGRFMVGYMK